MISTVLFDLDGTLLPMDNDEFTKYYFRLLCKKLAPYGYDQQKLIDGIWAGTAAMIKNDGSVSNEIAFWDKFAALMGEHVRSDEPLFDSFYRNEFNEAKAICGFERTLVNLVHDLKASGVRVALATNPIFPAVATESRIRWAGLEPSDFELYTTYENIGYAKPNPAYYREILRRMDVPAPEVLMVGNDATEDMAAREIGAQVFLLTDHLLNKNGVDISQFPHGGVDALRKLLF